MLWTNTTLVAHVLRGGSDRHTVLSYLLTGPLITIVAITINVINTTQPFSTQPNPTQPNLPSYPYNQRARLSAVPTHSQPQNALTLPIPLSFPFANTISQYRLNEA